MTEFKRDHFGFYQTSSRKLKSNLRNTWEQDQTYNKSSGCHSMSSPSWIKHIPEPVPGNIISSLFNCNYGETGDQGDEIVLSTRPESVDIKEELTDDEGSEYIVPDRGRIRRRGGDLRKQRKRCHKEDPILSADSEFVLYQDLSDSDMENGSKRRTFERPNACAHIFETFSSCYPIPSTIQCIAPTTLFNIDDEFSCPCLLPQKVSRRRPFTNTNSSQGVAETSSKQCPRSSFTYPIDNDCSSISMLPETSAFDYRASVITSRRIDHGDDRGRLPVIDEISTSESASSPCLETLESKVVIKDTANIGEVHLDFSTKTSITQPMQSDTLAVTCRSSSSSLSGFRVSGHVSLTPVDVLPSPNTECDITTSEKLCKTTVLNESKPENDTEAAGCGKQSLTKLAEHNSSELSLAALKLIILHSIDFGNPIVEELGSKEGTENSEQNSNVHQLMPCGCEQEPSVTTNLIDLGVNSGKESSSCHNLKNEDEFHSAVDLKISEEICPITGEKVECTGPVSQYSSASSCNPQGNCEHEPIKKQNISSSYTKVSSTNESSSRESKRIQSEVQMHIPVEKSPNSKTKIVFASPVESFKPLITERQDPAIISRSTQHLDQRPGINIVKQTVSSVYCRDTKYVRLNTPLMCDQLPIGESRQSVSPKDGDWCRSIVQVQIALEPVPKSDRKAAIEAPPVLENKRCTQLSKPSDNTLEGKANLHDYVKQYCDNSDKEERIYVIVIPSRISIGHASLQMNNTTRVVSDPSVDIESVLSCAPCKAGQLSLQSSEQTPDGPSTSASLVTHLSRITVILPENENSEIVNSTEETNMEKTTTCEERKPRIHPDNVTRCCPPRVEGISGTETRTTSTSQNVQNVDQSPELPNEDDISARMRNFKYRTENLKNKINEVACNKQSRGVSQIPPPPPRKDDRFYINESSTYRPGPWPAQAKLLEPPLASRIKKELIDVTAEVRELEGEMSKLPMCLEKRKLLGVGQRELMISERSVPSIQKKSTIKLETPSKRAGYSRIASEMPPLLVEDSSVRYKSRTRNSEEMPVIFNITADSMDSTKTSSVQSPVRSRVSSKHSLELPVRSKIDEGLHATTIKHSENAEEFPVCSKSTSIFSRPLEIAEASISALSLSRITEMLPDWSKLLSKIADIILPRTPSTSEGKSVSSSRLEETSLLKSRATEDIKKESKIILTKLSKTEMYSLLASGKSSRIKEKSFPTLALSKSQIRSKRSLKTEQLKKSRSPSRIDKLSLIKTTPSNTEKESANSSRKQSKTVVEFPVEWKAWARTEDQSPDQSVSGEFPFRLRKPSRNEQEFNINSKRPKWIEGSPVISRTLPMTERQILARSRTPSKFGEGSLINLRPPSRTEEEFPFMSRKASWTEPARQRTSSAIFQELPRSRTPSKIEERSVVTSRKPSEITKEFPVGSRTPSGTDEELPIRARKQSNIKERSLIRLSLPSRTEEEFPFMPRKASWTEPARRRTSSAIFQELPRSRTLSRIEERSAVTSRKPSEITKEFPVGSRTPSGTDEELPIRARKQSNIKERSLIRLSLPSRTEEEFPFMPRKASWTEPARRRTSSAIFQELPRSRTLPRIEERSAVTSRKPSEITKELPVGSRTPSGTDEELPIRAREQSNIKKRSLIRLSLPTRTEEVFPLNSETSLLTEEARPIRRRTSSTTAKEISNRSRTTSMIREESHDKYRRPSSIRVECSNRSITPSRNEEELPIRSKLPSRFGKELPIRRRTPSLAEEEIPIRPKTPSSVTERSTIRRRKPSRTEEEFPFKAMSPWSEEKSPIRRRTSSKITEDLPARPPEPSQIEDDLPISSRMLSMDEEQESPIISRTSSWVADESLTRPRAASLFENVPLRASISSSIAEEPLISPKSLSVRKESFTRSSVPSRITEESPVSTKRPSNVAKESLVSSRRSSKIEEDAEKPREFSTRRPSNVAKESLVSSRRSSKIKEDAEKPRESTKGGLTTEQWKGLDRMIDRYDKWTDDVKEDSDKHN